MIPGYNHNVKYKDRIFHVQTEDSGVQNPHIITILYYGGNILDSVKLSYADKVKSPDLNDSLPKIMQTQHKDVLRGLITGRYDQRIAERAKGASFLNGPAPLNVDAGAQHQASLGMAPGVAEMLAAKGRQARAAAAAAAAAATAGQRLPEVDGTFATGEGSLLDAFARAIPTLDAEALKAALDSDDDSFVFGGDTESKGFDEMALDFLKGT